MVYQSPCDPCPYLSYEVDEFGECIFEECLKPDSGDCWIEVAIYGELPFLDPNLGSTEC